jgi:uncharacterized protein
MKLTFDTPEIAEGAAGATHSVSQADVVACVRSQARAFFELARASHDWDHTERVWRICECIGPAESADMTVLRIAAYLHDIGRCDQDASRGAICHAQRGAAMAGELIAPLALSPARKDNIVHCIRSHRFRGDCPPRTKEAKSLFDADKLDAIGAVGVARAFLFAGEVGARLHNPEVDVVHTRPYSKDDTGYREFKVKLCRIKDRMVTREGRRLARERHAFMVSFFERLQDEYEGKR